MRRLTTSRNEARSIERGLHVPGDRESDPNPMMASRSIPEGLPACWASVPFLKLPANRWVSRKLLLNRGGAAWSAARAVRLVDARNARSLGSNRADR